MVAHLPGTCLTPVNAIGSHAIGVDPETLLVGVVLK